MSAAIRSHGMAIHVGPRGLGFEGALRGDCASAGRPLVRSHAWPWAGDKIHCLRRPDARVGLAGRRQRNRPPTWAWGIDLDEAGHSVAPTPVASACELLGWIRSTWPTRAGWWPHSARGSRTRLDILRSHPAAPRSSRHWHGPPSVMRASSSCAASWARPDPRPSFRRQMRGFCCAANRNCQPTEESLPSFPGSLPIFRSRYHAAHSGALVGRPV